MMQDTYFHSCYIPTVRVTKLILFYFPFQAGRIQTANEARRKKKASVGSTFKFHCWSNGEIFDMVN